MATLTSADGGSATNLVFPSPPAASTARGAVPARSPGLGPGGSTQTFPEETIPARVLASYQQAADELARTEPSCHLPWQLLAGIGRIESNHAEGGLVTAAGETLTPILGPELNGQNGFAAIRDTDQGRWDGDKVWDRAVGPMQFIPSTWATMGRDATHDGVADPNNVDDASLSAAYYLCGYQRDLTNPVTLNQAVFSYNHSTEYVAAVLAWTVAYAAYGPLPTISTAVATAATSAALAAAVPAPTGQAGSWPLPPNGPVGPSTGVSGTSTPAPQPSPSCTAQSPSPSLSPTPVPSATTPSPASSTPTPSPSPSPSPSVDPTPSPTATTTTTAPTSSPTPDPCVDPSPTSS